MKTIFRPAAVIAPLLVVILAAPLPVAAQTGSPVGVTLAKSGNDIVLSFSTTGTQLYTVQARADFSQPWTNFQSAMGIGTVNMVTITNALSAGKGYYRLLIQPKPMSLVLPQANAFAILGHSCGGIREQIFLTGFDPATGLSRRW